MKKKEPKLKRIEPGNCLDHIDRFIWLWKHNQHKGWVLAQGVVIVGRHCWLEHTGTDGREWVYDLTNPFCPCQKDTYYRLLRPLDVATFVIADVISLLYQGNYMQGWWAWDDELDKMESSYKTTKCDKY